jgi:hypothetical protein
MPTALLDLSLSITCIWLWQCYKEQTWASRAFWGLFGFFFGSIAVGSYLLLQLAQLKPNEPAWYILFRGNHPTTAGARTRSLGQGRHVAQGIGRDETVGEKISDTAEELKEKVGEKVSKNKAKRQSRRKSNMLLDALML